MLSDFFPDNWVKIFLYAEVSKNSSSLFYTFQDISDILYEGAKIRDLLKITRKQELIFIDDLLRVVEDLLKTMKDEGQEEWSTFTFILTNDGKFKTTFGYEDLLASDEYERRISWKKKYL